MRHMKYAFSDLYITSHCGRTSACLSVGTLFVAYRRTQAISRSMIEAIAPTQFFAQIVWISTSANPSSTRLWRVSFGL